LQQIEHLIVRLLTQEYLQEEYHETSYCRVVYVAPGPLAARLSYHTRQSIKGEVKGKLEFLFPCSEIKSGTKRKNVDSNQPSGPKKRKVSAKSSKAKAKLKTVEPDNQEGDEDGPENAFLEGENISFLSDDEASSQKILPKYLPVDDDYDSIDLNLSDDNDDSTNNFTWSHSLLEEPQARFKPYLKISLKLVGLL
jgi:ATP-dependent DNA helicase Q1